MIKSYFSAWKRSFDFQGISTRKEYWEFIFLNTIIFLIFYFLFMVILSIEYLYNSSIYPYTSLSVLQRLFLYSITSSGWLFLLGSVWVAFPLTIRRLRDIGMSWKWILLVIMPYIGGLFVLIFLTRPSMIIINDKQYYLKYRTKKQDIFLICLASFIVISLVLFYLSALIFI